jgi:hypothetical protein
MQSVNEGSRLPLTFKLFNFATQLQKPLTLRYRIDCESTGRELVGWTTLDPASIVSLVVPSSVNAIQNRANNFELKTMTVESDPDTENAFNEEYTWRVKNLQGVT